jgi:putative acetyltransferase
MQIRREAPTDAAAVRRVHEDAFRQSQEADLVDSLREQHLATISLVAEMDDAVVGHVLLSHLDVIAGGRSVTAAALGPVAVTSGWQNQGIGSRLIREALEQARAQGIAVVLVLGHPGYYPRFGFSAERARLLASPYSSHGAAWMAAELIPGALPPMAGTVAYPAPWAMFD